MLILNINHNVFPICHALEVAYIIVTCYSYMPHVLAPSGPSSGRDQIQEIYETPMCIITRNCSSYIYKKKT